MTLALLSLPPEPVVAFVARSSADESDNIIAYDRNQQG